MNLCVDVYFISDTHARIRLKRINCIFFSNTKNTLSSLLHSSLYIFLYLIYNMFTNKHYINIYIYRYIPNIFAACVQQINNFFLPST